MHTQTARFSSRPARKEAGWLVRLLAATGRVLWFLAVTAAFTGFCLAAGFAGWYLMNFFENGSYKLAALFIVAILVSNVGSKYARWYLVS